jgi:hypothetical protein
VQVSLCHHRAILSPKPDHMPVLTFGPGMVCKGSLQKRPASIILASRYPPAACCWLKGCSSEQPLLFVEIVMRTWVYVDGFNIYYGAVKGTAFKWLNLVELARRVLPAGHTVERVKYFTAHVSGAADPGAPRRQHIYLSALRTLPEIEIHFGRFLAKTIWRPIINLPVAGAQIHSPVPVSLPAGDHLVTGGSLQTPARLAVKTYPPKGAPRSAGTPSVLD